VGNSKPEEMPAHMLDPAMKKKDFVCKLCGESRTHGGWEDTEVRFTENSDVVHLGCLTSYSQTLTTQAKLALENLKSGIQSLENCDLTSTAMKSFQDALNNLKTGLHCD